MKTILILITLLAAPYICSAGSYEVQDNTSIGTRSTLKSPSATTQEDIYNSRVMTNTDTPKPAKSNYNTPSSSSSTPKDVRPNKNSSVRW